jgi:hypothetical protein
MYDSSIQARRWVAASIAPETKPVKYADIDQRKGHLAAVEEQKRPFSSCGALSEDDKTVRFPGDNGRAQVLAHAHCVRPDLVQAQQVPTRMTCVRLLRLYIMDTGA